VMELIATHVAVLAVGYFAGRRAFRRQLQTTDGRRRAGVVATAMREATAPQMAVVPRTVPVQVVTVNPPSGRSNVVRLPVRTAQ
jgi:hypothetical protein